MLWVGKSTSLGCGRLVGSVFLLGPGFRGLFPLLMQGFALCGHSLLEHPSPPGHLLLTLQISAPASSPQKSFLSSPLSVKPLHVRMSQQPCSSILQHSLRLSSHMCF